MAPRVEAGEITVERPWARATAGGQTNGAVYLVLRNGGTAPERLVAARTDVARAVELHTHLITAEGVAQMRPVAAIEVPPGGEARLAPGEAHVMLVGLSGPLVAGASFPMTLVLERGGELTVEVRVESLRGGGSDAGHGHQH